MMTKRHPIVSGNETDVNNPWISRNFFREFFKWNRAGRPGRMNHALMNLKNVMKTIESVAKVDPNGILTAHVPPEIPPGEHKVELVMENFPTRKTTPSIGFPSPQCGTLAG